MSLILDALRKSEAERRRGQSPDLFAPLASTSPVARPGLRWLPVAIFVVLIGASAWVVWDGRTQRALDGVASADPIGRQPGDAEAGEALAIPGADPDADSGDRAVSSSAATTPGAPPSAAPSPAPPTASPAPIAKTDNASDNPSTYTADTTPPTPSRALAAPAPTNTRAPAPLPAPQAPPESPAAATAAESSAEESLPTLAVLDSVTRGTLPPLKLSMHVWGQEPGKRFAIVDGQRVAEGSLLGNGVVEQIRRDGVVINVNGQRLLLPKP